MNLKSELHQRSCGKVQSTKTPPATGDANEARSINIMVNGRPATLFVSSFGRLLESSFIGERARLGNHTGDDPD
jgi:hypothetical protein